MRAADVVALKRRKTLQGRLVAWRLRAAREKLRWQHADVRADRIYNRTMLVKLVRNWRVAVDAFKRDAAIAARVAAKRAGGERLAGRRRPWGVARRLPVGRSGFAPRWVIFYGRPGPAP